MEKIWVISIRIYCKQAIIFEYSYFMWNWTTNAVNVANVCSVKPTFHSLKYDKLSELDDSSAMPELILYCGQLRACGKWQTQNVQDTIVQQPPTEMNGFHRLFPAVFFDICQYFRSEESSVGLTDHAHALFIFVCWCNLRPCHNLNRTETLSFTQNWEIRHKRPSQTTRIWKYDFATRNFYFWLSRRAPSLLSGSDDVLSLFSVTFCERDSPPPPFLVMMETI